MKLSQYRIAEEPYESFWIVCMNSKRRAICRMRMAAETCVAATVGVRQIVRAMILSEAMAVACLRTEQAANPTESAGKTLAE
jgi:DNA repair protein RadC